MSIGQPSCKQRARAVTEQWTPRSLLTFTYSNLLSESVIAGRFLSKLCTCDIWLVDSNIGIYTVHSKMQFCKEAFFFVVAQSSQSTTSKQPLPMETP